MAPGMLQGMWFYGLPLGQDCHTAHSIGLSEVYCHPVVAEDSVGVESSEDGLKKVAGTGDSTKKRKTIAKEEDSDTANAKKKKKLATEETEALEHSDNNTKKKEGLRESSHTKAASEPLKTEYIHVRARRGQATDSHSLAERVRREKIGERMKNLQDLVPGCNNITGKASVLDEIINYVQSLQKQVEFLSMKLAAVDPLTDFNMQSFIEEEINSSTCTTSISREMSSELLKSSYPLFNQLQPAMHSDQVELGITMNLPEFGSLQRTISTPLSVPDSFSETYFDVCGSAAWDYNLQELYNKMDIARGRENAFPFHLHQGGDDRV